MSGLRFKPGDRVRINVTVGDLYNKTGTVIGLGSNQCFVQSQCYPTFNYKIKLDEGKEISIHERFLNLGNG